MNTDTGEIKQFKAEELKAALDRGEPWVQLSTRAARRLSAFSATDRPGVLSHWRERKDRLHARALARKKRGR